MHGVLLSAYQITYFLSTPPVGMYMAKWGRKNTIGYGMVLLALSTALVALASLSTSSVTFWSVSFLGRCLQGVGDGLAYVPILSLITLEFPERNEVYQGYAMMALGGGFSLGPFLAAIVIR